MAAWALLSAGLLLERSLARLVLRPLAPLVPFLRRRLAFELKNLDDPFSREHPGLAVEACVHVSSEGELEQALPLLEGVAGRGLAVEVLYTSPSVEPAVRRFCGSAGGRAFALRLPLLTGGLGRWVRAPRLAMVRYDFFPSLLALARTRRSLLLSAVLRGSPGPRRPLPHRFFDLLLPASEEDAARLRAAGLGPRLLPWFDLRAVRLQSRLRRARRTLEEDGRVRPLLALLERVPFRRRLILGNYWDAERDVLRDPDLAADAASLGTLVVVAPHRTDGASVERVLAGLSAALGDGTPVHVLDGGAPPLAEAWERSPGVVVFPGRGVLAELYTLFDTAYVGGGHGKGVHSLLEPFMAGARVLCGPGTSRSTELGFVRSLDPDAVDVVERPLDVYGRALRLAPRPAGSPQPGTAGPASARHGNVVAEMRNRFGASP